MVMLDKLLILRLNSVKSITECLNVIYPKFWYITSHSKGQITVGFCSFVAYFNQLLFAS
jgi:hypothetical protein